MIGRRPAKLGQAAHGRVLVVTADHLFSRPAPYGLGARFIRKSLTEIDRARVACEAAHHLEDGRRQIGVDGVDQGDLLARGRRPYQTHAMRIVDFEPRHAEAWRTLNEAWISRHFAIEPADEEVLGDPVGTVIAPGGHIFMAEDDDGAAIGCVGLKAMADGGFEVIKMTVSETARGTGLGLPIVKKIVDEHQGSIEIRNRPGEGAAVLVFLQKVNGAAKPSLVRGALQTDDTSAAVRPVRSA